MDVLNEAFAAAGIEAPVAQVDGVLGNVGAEKNAWTLVKHRKFGMPRRVSVRQEEEAAPQPERVIDLEYEWLPKSGPLRAIKKWAQIRKSGMIGTPAGPAILVYGCYSLY